MDLKSHTLIFVSQLHVRKTPWTASVCADRTMSTVLGFSTIMLVSGFYGLLSAYGRFIRQVARAKGIRLADSLLTPYAFERCTRMLWQEGIHYFVMIWAVQLSETVCTLPLLP